MGFVEHLRARVQLAVMDEGLTLASLADRAAALHGNRMLIATPSGVGWTAAQAAGAVEHASSVLHGRVKAGDRVLVDLANGPELVLGCLAVCRAGGVAVPVNDASTDIERAHVKRDSGSKITLNDPSLLAPREPSRAHTVSHERNPADVAVLLYTSGTTGKPKGAALTHRGLLASTRRLALLPTGLRRDEIVTALPLAHIMGFSGLLSTLTAGLPAYVMPRFRPNDVLDAIEQRRATMFVGVPTMYRMMIEAGAKNRDLKSVRVWMSGADAMPPDLARQFQKMGASITLPLTGLPLGEALFFEGYGMVELSGAAIMKVTPPYSGGRFSRARGMSMPGYRTRIVDDHDSTVRIGQIGELLVTGPGVLDGYFGDEAATAATRTADGWVRTGDLARRGVAGTVEFIGRAKDVIKVGGYSVYAAEVQAALEGIEGVLEAAVVALPDPRKGERVAAALRVLPSAMIDPEAVKKTVAESLAAYKVPSVIVIVDELPLTTTGKIRRNELRALLEKASVPT